MRKLFLLLFFCFAVIGYSKGQTPTRDNVINAMKALWEHPANSMQLKTTIVIKDIKIGKSSAPTYQQQLDGIPKDAIVTATTIDFVETSFITDSIKKVRRITTGLMYKDKNGEWAVKNTNTSYPSK